MYTKGYYAHVFKYIEYKEDDRGVAVEFDQPETPIHVTTQEYINVLLVDGYEVDDC